MTDFQNSQNSSSMDKKRKNKSSGKNKKSKKIKIENEEPVEKNNTVDDGNASEAMNENENENTVIEGSKNETQEFDAKSLRNSIVSGNGIIELQKFVKMCKQSSDNKLATDYLKSGGSVLEILRLLDSSEKKNHNNANTVFTAMQIIIMKILEKFPQYHASTEEACRHFINSHLSTVNSMLSEHSNVKYRKSVLKLLAVIVSLGGTIPCELLNHLSLHSGLIETLARPTTTADKENVRLCFIHFILAFLIEGNIFAIRTLLDKHAILTSIFPEMVYDDANVVNLVMMSLKKYVLESIQISKTLKLHIFSTLVIRNIVNLYYWKGPKNWHGYKKKVSTNEVDPEEKQIAIEAVHKFLITLLTSTRYGVAFQDRSLGTDPAHKHNQLINTVLQSLEKPWEHEKPAELVIQILKRCPDLIKAQLIYIEPYLTPRLSKNWFCLINFIKQITITIDLNNCLKLAAPNLNSNQLANAIVQIILPPIVLKNAIHPVFEQDDVTLQYVIIELLGTMLDKIDVALKSIHQFKENFSDINTFKTTILDYLRRNLPGLEKILQVWNNSLNSQSHESNDELNEIDLSPNTEDILLKILDLLQYYIDLCPELSTNLDESNLNPTVLVTGLETLEGINIDKLNLLKIRGIRILIASNSILFSPNQDLYKSALLFLMSSIGTMDPINDSELQKTATMLLVESSLFEGCHEEIEIWLQSMNNFKSTNEKSNIAKWVLKIIKKVLKKTDKYINGIYESKDNTVDNENALRLSDICNELDIKSFTGEDGIQMQAITSISLLLYASIKHLAEVSDDEIKKFMSFILIHCLHHQINFSHLIYLTKDLKIPATRYLQSWSSENYFPELKKPFPKNCIYRIISKILFSKEVCQIEYKDSTISIQENNDDEKRLIFNDFDCKAVLRMILFYLKHVSEEKQKLEYNFGPYKSFLIAFFKYMKHQTLDNSTNILKDCLSIFFKNPFLLKNFSVIYNERNTFSYQITLLIQDICGLFILSDKSQEDTISFYLLPYRNKFIMQIENSTKKSKSILEKTGAMFDSKFFRLLQLSNHNALDLLKSVLAVKNYFFLMEKEKDLSYWGSIVPELLNFLCTFKTSKSYNIIDHGSLKKIFHILLSLKSTIKVVDNWETSIYSYLQTFPEILYDFDTGILVPLLRTHITENIIKIISLFAKMDDKCIFKFVKISETKEDLLIHKNLVLSIISSNLSYKWGKHIMMKLYKLYANDIKQFLIGFPKDTPAWITGNIQAVIYLVDNYFDHTECQDLCKNIMVNGDKFELITKEHIEVYEVLFTKIAKKSSEELKNFLHVLLHTIVIVLKKDSKNNDKMNYICRTIINIINLSKVIDNQFTFEEINKNYSWTQFTRISLKTGLKPSKSDNTNVPCLIKTLAALCDIGYRDKSNEEYVRNIFEMATSHSEFMNIMLHSSKLKDDLVKLLWVLIQKNLSILSTKHVPLYLASYQAFFTIGDQYILKILQFYENNNIKLNDYRPYLWGNAAALHYSVKSGTDTALLRQPSVSQVLDLFDIDIVNNTIANYPVYRNFTETFFNFNEKVKMYDPAFYLPLFLHLLADYNLVPCSKVIHSGALAMTIKACSSECQSMRLAAFTLISRFYSHLESISSREKVMWLNFIDCLRNGIVESESPLEIVQLNGFVSTFMAKATFIISQPMHQLYSSLQKFFIAKPSISLNTIPELLHLYHSSEVDYLSHRQWILEVVRDGMQTYEDVDVAMNCTLFKMIFCFCTCKLATKSDQKLILEIILAAVKKPKICARLIEEYSLLPWLLNCAQSLSKNNENCLQSIVDIVYEIFIYFCMRNMQKAFYSILLLKILTIVQSKVSSYSETNLKEYINDTRIIVSSMEEDE